MVSTPYNLAVEKVIQTGLHTYLPDIPNQVSPKPHAHNPTNFFIPHLSNTYYYSNNQSFTL